MAPPPQPATPARASAANITVVGTVDTFLSSIRFILPNGKLPHGSRSLPRGSSQFTLQVKPSAPDEFPRASGRSDDYRFVSDTTSCPRKLIMLQNTTTLMFSLNIWAEPSHIATPPVPGWKL